MKREITTTLNILSIVWVTSLTLPETIYRYLLLQPNIELVQNYSCSPKKTCGKMRSCSEAVFHLYQCGDRKRDGDNDGIPCEKLCGKTKQSMQQKLDNGL